MSEWAGAGHGKRETDDSALRVNILRGIPLFPCSPVLASRSLFALLLRGPALPLLPRPSAAPAINCNANFNRAAPRALGPLPSRRKSHSCKAVGGALFISGGYDASGRQLPEADAFQLGMHPPLQ